jgi:hypothetical protein
MLIYRDKYGAQFEGRNSIDVVVQMRRAAWMAPGKQAYMAGVAKRVADLWPGVAAIVTTTARAFLHSLVKAGILTKVA